MLDKISCAPPIVLPTTVTTSSESEPLPPAKLTPVKKTKKKLKAPPKKSLLDINLTSSDEDQDTSYNEPAEQTPPDTVVMSTWDEPEVRAPVDRANSLKLVHIDTAPVAPVVPVVDVQEPPQPVPVVKQKKPKKVKEVKEVLKEAVRTEQDELDDFFGESTPKEAPAPAAKETKVKKEKKGKKKKKKTAAVADTGYEEF